MTAHTETQELTARIALGERIQQVAKEHHEAHLANRVAVAAQKLLEMSQA